MKNKKLLYGIVLIGALVGFYFWNKNKKSGTCATCGMSRPEGDVADENFSNISAGGKYCTVCERPDKTTYFAVGGGCASGDMCIVSRNRTTTNTSMM